MWIWHWYDGIWLNITFFPKWIVWYHVASASSKAPIWQCWIPPLSGIQLVGTVEYVEPDWGSWDEKRDRSPAEIQPMDHNFSLFPLWYFIGLPLFAKLDRDFCLVRWGKSPYSGLGSIYSKLKRQSCQVRYVRTHVKMSEYVPGWITHTCQHCLQDLNSNQRARVNYIDFLTSPWPFVAWWRVIPWSWGWGWDDFSQAIQPNCSDHLFFGGPF